MISSLVITPISLSLGNRNFEGKDFNKSFEGKAAGFFESLSNFVLSHSKKIVIISMNLSAKNGWQDDDGRVYIIYTIDEVQDDLGCANKKAVNILAELEDIGLIEKKRQGLTKPNLIYVKNFSSEVLKEHFQKCQNDTSGNVELTGQEVSKGRTNNTDNNNTDFNDTDSIPFHSDRIRLYRESPQENGMEGNGNDALQIRKKYQDYVAENISLEILKERYPYQRARSVGRADGGCSLFDQGSHLCWERGQTCTDCEGTVHED